MWEGNSGYQLDIAHIYTYTYVHMAVWPWAQCSARCSNPQAEPMSRLRLSKDVAKATRRQRSRRSRSQGQLIGQEVQPVHVQEQTVWAAIERQSSIFKMAVKTVDLEHSAFIGGRRVARQRGESRLSGARVAWGGVHSERVSAWTLLVTQGQAAATQIEPNISKNINQLRRIQLKNTKIYINLAQVELHMRGKREEGAARSVSSCIRHININIKINMNSRQRPRPTHWLRVPGREGFVVASCRARSCSSCPHPVGSSTNPRSACCSSAGADGGCTRRCRPSQIMALSRCKYRAASCQSMDARQAAFNVPQSQRALEQQQHTHSFHSQSVHINFTQVSQTPTAAVQFSSLRLSTQLNRRH